MIAGSHETVLRDEATVALAIRPDGAYVDGTYGRGGHARAILEQLGESGRLVVIDQDPTAIEHARLAFDGDARVTVCHSRFDQLAEVLAEHGIDAIDGLLLDLGVSSPQLDDASRGFSFSHDGPLDMRMDTSSGVTAAQWLASSEERDIANVIYRFGEERNSRRIARAIVARRKEGGIASTADLAEIVRDASRRHDSNKHPATRTFQALRIYLNDELGALERVLEAALVVCRRGGRIVVISFHSLEDRIVKRFFRDQSSGQALPRRLPVRDAEIVRRLRTIGRAVKASDAEVAANRRARSAVMRVAEKVA